MKRKSIDTSLIYVDESEKHRHMKGSDMAGQYAGVGHDNPLVFAANRR